MLFIKYTNILRLPLL